MSWQRYVQMLGLTSSTMVAYGLEARCSTGDLHMRPPVMMLGPIAAASTHPRFSCRHLPGILLAQTYAS